MLPPCGFGGGGKRMISSVYCNACAGGGNERFNKHMAAVRSSREPRSDATRNHEALVRAATAAVHREGPRVPMATIAAEALRRFIEAAISQRNELVLPLHGGPPLRSPRTRAVREQIHRILRQIIDRGRADGTVRQDVTPREIVVFGAMLAQPRGPDPDWDTTCRRLLATYLAGLGTLTPR